MAEDLRKPLSHAFVKNRYVFRTFSELSFASQSYVRLLTMNSS